MATVKPTPEEKLFSVIQGAKATPLRGKGSKKTIGQLARQAWELLAALDLPRINQLLTGLIIVLCLGLAVQFFTQPNIDQLIANSEAPEPFRIDPPLQGLKPLDDYLPKVLEQDPFRVGQVQPQPPAQPGEQAESRPDPKALVANMRLVGISLGEVPTAMIEMEKQTYFLKPGDAIGAVTVKEIQKDHVILKSGEQEVDLF